MRVFRVVNFLLREDTFAGLYGIKHKWFNIDIGVLEENPELVDELFILLQNAYENIGGHLKFKRSIDLINGEISIIKAIDIDEDPEPDAMLGIKKKRYGFKYVVMGHDKSREGKRVAMQKQIDDLMSGGYYAEVSEKLAEVLLKKFSVNIINDKEEVERILDKDIEWMGTHPSKNLSKYEGWYIRNIGGKNVMKILIGLPVNK